MQRGSRELHSRVYCASTSFFYIFFHFLHVRKLELYLFRSIGIQTCVCNASFIFTCLRNNIRVTISCLWIVSLWNLQRIVKNIQDNKVRNRMPQCKFEVYNIISCVLFFFRLSPRNSTLLGYRTHLCFDYIFSGKQYHHVMNLVLFWCAADRAYSPYETIETKY